MNSKRIKSTTRPAPGLAPGLAPEHTATGNSVQTASSREAFFAQKSASFDLVDACTQANLSCDVITYDSDDEMVKSKRGIPFGGLRNKKGHPIYSREDIREQYCITRKELDVLEHNFRDSSAARLFGCLSTSHLPESHCNKSSFLLLSCVQRRKNSSEFDEESDQSVKPLDNPKLDSIRREIDEEDSSDGGFKQRVSASHPITRTVQRIESIESTGSTDTQQSQTIRQSSQYSQRHRFEKTCSSFDSYDPNTNQPNMNSPLKRPTNLYFSDNMETPQLNTTTSHSVDELSDRQTDECLSWKGSRIAKTPDIIDDNRQMMKKHVTFATTHLVRSATVGGINNIHSTQPTQPMGERLIDDKTQANGSVAMKKTDSIDSFDQKSTNSMRIYDYLPLYRAMRRAVMKTQATQTDTVSKGSATRASSRRSIPAYLTLSPRSSKPDSEVIYSRSYDSDDEDVLQISLKDKKLRKIHKTKTLDKTKQRRKMRTISKTSPKSSVQTEDNLRINLDEIEFQKFDSESPESSRTDGLIKKELNSKSSTDSNQLKSDSDVISSATNDLESSFRSALDSQSHSQDSTTIVSELNDSLITNEDKHRLIDESIDDFVEATDVTKRPLIIDPKKVVMKTSESSFTSPDSENYSFPVEHKPSIATEVSPQGSGSPPVDNIDSGGSSVYVSANDASPLKEKDKTSGQTSFETASSGSRFSSPPSTDQNKCSNSDKEFEVEATIENQEKIKIYNKSLQSKSSIPMKLMEELLNESTSDTSVEVFESKDRTFSPESTASTHNSTEHNIEDFDSEDVGDITPIQDLSTDTSTVVETSTIIENVVKISLKPKIPPKPTFLLGDQKINISEQTCVPLHTSAVKVLDESLSIAKTESMESVEQQSDDNDEVIDDVSGGDFIIRRNISGELSTVSEVSEEISANGRSYKSDSGSGIHMLKMDRKSSANNGNDLNLVSSSDTGEIRSNTPSFAESTTSGSFMIDGNLTEPNSLSEPIERPKIEKSGSFPSILTENIDKTFPIDSYVLDGTNDCVNNEVFDRQELEQTAVESSNASNIEIQNSELIAQQILTETIAETVAQELIQSDPNIQTIETTTELLDNKSLKQKTDVNNKASVVEIEAQIDGSKRHIIAGKQTEILVRKRRENLKKSQTEATDLGRPIFTCEEWTAIVQRRSRSLSKSPEKLLRRLNERPHSCGRHQFACRQCGERASEHTVPSLAINKSVYPFSHLKSFPIETTYHNRIEDDEDIGIHTESYRSALWLYVGRKDELTVWGHKCHKRSINSKHRVNGGSPANRLVRSDSVESTLSERQFRRQYESVTHRMIHRRASIEMYKRAVQQNFVIEKEIVINRVNNEFGFRIHGSRPVVVSAIEKNTPAETCGLDVGDIVVTINGSNVMDSSHSDVVKLAHSGADTLRLEVVSTRNALNNDLISIDNEVYNCDIVINGYLTKFNVDSNSKPIRKNRWFALKSDNCLYWYKSTKEMDPLGVICLQGYTASSAPEMMADQPFAFRLVKLETEVKYFAAKDSDTVGQWVNAINQRATKVNQTDPYIEIVLNNITRSASSLAPTDCTGYLAIFSQRRKVWRNRYFVLKDASLYFYLDSNANASLGVFFLHGYRVQSCILIGKKNTFETIPPESKFKHLWLMAESDVDKKRWLAALEYSIDRWIRL